MALDRIDVLVDQKPFTWKLVNSLWIVVIVMGLGIFSIFGWLWAGLLAKSPKIWRIVAIWGVVVALLFLSLALSENNKDSVWDTLGSTLLMASWIGSFAHALIIRGTILREIVSREEELARLYDQYNSSRGVNRFAVTESSPTVSVPLRTPLHQRSPLRSSPSQDPLPQELGIDMSRYYARPMPPRPRTAWAPAPPTATRSSAPTPSSPTARPAASHISSPPSSPSPAASHPLPTSPALVDVNTAPSAVLLGLPALDQAAVERIVAAREERGGFHDLNDLTSAAALQPHQLVALQGRVSFSRFRRPGTQVHGRILDL